MRFGDYTQVTTDDGDTLSVDGDVAIGSAVYTTDDNGMLQAAPDDDYTLNDGRTITVASGKITNIAGDPDATTDPQDNTASPDAEMSKEKLADAAPAPTDAPATPSTGSNATPDTDLADRVTNLENQMAEVLQVLTAATSMNEQLANQNKNLKEKVEMLSKEPATEVAITTKKLGFNSNAKDSELEKLMTLTKKFRNAK